MAEARTFRLRVRYGKVGRLSMLSHLEITHALERLVRRSSLPFALSQGFSPHMKIAFGPALPVGVGGTDEVFDVTLTAYVAPDKALSALKARAPFASSLRLCGTPGSGCIGSLPNEQLRGVPFLSFGEHART